MMNKSIKEKQLHSLFNILSWGIFLISLIRMLLAYGTLPNEIGVHFGGDGNFDVIADRIFAFYPYVVSIIMLLFCEILTWVIEKVKTGLRMSRKGEEQLKGTIKVFLDIFKLCNVVFYSGIWADSVIKQQPMSMFVTMLISWIYIISLMTFFVALIVIRVKNPLKNTDKRDDK